MVSKPYMGKPLTRIAAAIGGALIVALALGAVLQPVLSWHTLSSTPPPGKLVDVGGHRLHLLCQGTGGPAVILEPGLPGSSLAWEAVSAEIKAFTSVCSYDRAGYGWSEAGPSPRTAGNMVQELSVLLRSYAIEPPYVLVGHSFGGLLMQLYASRFPDEVAGMVLVDSSHPDQVSQTKDLETVSMLGTVIRVLAPFGIPRFLFPVPAGSPESRTNAVRSLERELQMTTKSIQTAASELTGLRQSLFDAGAYRPDLGQRPLIVLTEGRRKAKFWLDMQEDLTKLSAVSDWQIVDDAGHFIHHDRPEAVVNAILRILEQIRSAPG